MARSVVLGIGLWLSGCVDDEPSTGMTEGAGGGPGPDSASTSTPYDPGPFDSCGMTYAGPCCSTTCGWDSSTSLASDATESVGSGTGSSGSDATDTDTDTDTDGSGTSCDTGGCGSSSSASSTETDTDTGTGGRELP